MITPTELRISIVRRAEDRWEVWLTEDAETDYWYPVLTLRLRDGCYERCILEDGWAESPHVSLCSCTTLEEAQWVQDHEGQDWYEVVKRDVARMNREREEA